MVFRNRIIFLPGFIFLYSVKQIPFKTNKLLISMTNQTKLLATLLCFTLSASLVWRSKWGHEI